MEKIQTHKMRLNYFINKPFQFKFILLSSIPFLLIMIVVFAAHFYFYKEQMKFGTSLGLAPDHGYFLMIDHQKRKMLQLLVASTSIIFAIGLISTTLISHKVAGPLYRLTNYLNHKNINDEKLHQLSFRPKDFFQEIPEAFNKFISKK